jgi:hypothetical protein
MQSRINKKEVKKLGGEIIEERLHLVISYACGLINVIKAIAL